MGEGEEMKVILLLTIILLFVPSGSLLSQHNVDGSKCGMAATEPVVDRCPANLVCFSISEWKEIREKIIDLEEREGLLRARKLSRLGSSVGCGGGVAFNDETNAALFCGYLWGFRW